MVSRLHSPVGNFLSSGRAITLAFAWGVAEALFWPVLPDFYLFAAIPAAPKQWWKLAIAATAGSVFGGAVGFAVAYVRESSVPIEYVPLITEGMIHEAGRLLATHGILGILAQPLSGIPYKVFVYLSGAARLNPFAFVWISAIARGTRILAVAGIAAAFGWIARKHLSRLYDYFLIAFVAIFAYSLYRIVTTFPTPP